MKLLVNEQAKSYLNAVIKGRPVKPNIGGFFWSKVEKHFVVFKCTDTVEFWEAKEVSQALDILAK